MSNLALLLPWRGKKLIGSGLASIPGMEMRFSLQVSVSGGRRLPPLKGWTGFFPGARSRHWIQERGGLIALGTGISGEEFRRSNPREEDKVLPVVEGEKGLAEALRRSCLYEAEKRNLDPRKLRVAVWGAGQLGLSCLQSLAEESRYLTLGGKVSRKAAQLQTQLLYTKGAAVSIEPGLEKFRTKAQVLVMTEPFEKRSLTELFPESTNNWGYDLKDPSSLMIKFPGRLEAEPGWGIRCCHALPLAIWPPWVYGLYRREATLDLIIPAVYAEGMIRCLLDKPDVADLNWTKCFDYFQIKVQRG